MRIRGLLFVQLVISCALLQGCGSSPSNVVTPVQQPQVKIAAPLDGSQVTTLPATIQVSFTNGADPTAMRALLDGVDITAQFSAADNNGLRQTQVDRPAVNLGKNQIQIRDGSLRAAASFNVSLGNGGSGQGSSLPLLVPIQTRVVTGNGTASTDYNIALYTDPNHPTTPTLIQAPVDDGSNAGFQIVYLRRSDLMVIQNTSVNNHNDGGFPLTTPLYSTLTNIPAGCGSGGCLVIVQSLGTIGYAPCPLASGNNGYSTDCFAFGQLFQNMGASARWLYANAANNQIAYSFIGNTNSGGPNNSMNPPGVYFERLTCSGSDTNQSNPCDYLAANSPNTSSTAPSNATPSQIGNMAGALIRDNYNNYTL
jgi:hypothetical protein